MSDSTAGEYRGISDVSAFLSTTGDNIGNSIWTTDAISVSSLPLSNWSPMTGYTWPDQWWYSRVEPLEIELTLTQVLHMRDLVRRGAARVRWTSIRSQSAGDSGRSSTGHRRFRPRRAD